MFQYLNKFKKFIGIEVWKLFRLSIVVGIIYFLIESSFILVLQAFLRALGLVELDKLKLPTWYPKDQYFAIYSLLLFGILRGVIFMVRTYLRGVTVQAFIRFKRSQLLKISIRNAHEVSTHEIVNLFNERIVQSGMVFSAMWTLIMNITSTVFFLILGLKLAYKEMLIGMTLLAILTIPLHKINKKLTLYGAGLLKESHKSITVLLQSIRNFFLLKIYGLQDEELEIAENSIANYEGHYKKYFTVTSLRDNLPTVFGIFVICFLTFLSLKFFNTPAVALVSFFYIFIRTAQYLSEASVIISNIKLQLPGVKFLYDWYEEKKHLLEDKDSKENIIDIPEKDLKELDRSFNESGILIKANDISYNYPDQKLLFSNLNLVVKKGEVLLIKGKSGVGKSTLLTILLGQKTPTSGEVLINSKNAVTIHPKIFSHIGYVGPEPYLINTTIKKNILYANTRFKINDSDILEALELAQIKDDVLNLNEGLNEVLQEHTQLSTGQKQRLAIARALVRKPKLLILDEATSNLDSETEESFIEVLAPILKNTTTIIVSHKSSFDQIATSRIVL